MPFLHIPVESSNGAVFFVVVVSLSCLSLHGGDTSGLCVSALRSLFSLNRLAVIRQCRHPIVFCSSMNR